MAFSLKKLLTQDLNPFDGPKKPQPASTAQSAPSGLSVGVARPQANVSVATTAPRPRVVVQAPVQVPQLPKVQIAPTQQLKANGQVYNNTTSIRPAAPIQSPLVKPNPFVNAIDRALSPVGAGVLRSGVGTAESLSGLYDLATPGKGQNQFGKNAQIAGANLDQAVKDANYSKVGYKGAQAVTDVGTFLLPGTQVKSTKLAAPISRALAPVADYNKAGNIAARTAGYLARPDVATNIATGTALSTGLRSNRGQDINAQNLALDAALNTGGALGLKVAGKGVQAGAQATTKLLRNNNIIRPFDINDVERAAINRTQLARQGYGSNMGDPDYELGLQALQRNNVNPYDPDQVGNVLSRLDGYDARQAMMRDPAVAQGGYVRIPGDASDDLVRKVYTRGTDDNSLYHGTESEQALKILGDGKIKVFSADKGSPTPSVSLSRQRNSGFYNGQNAGVKFVVDNNKIGKTKGYVDGDIKPSDYTNPQSFENEQRSLKDIDLKNVKRVEIRPSQMTPDEEATIRALAKERGIKVVSDENPAEMRSVLSKRESDSQFGKVLQDAGVAPKGNSKFAKAVSTSGEISPELQQSVKKSIPTYDKVTNTDQLAASTKLTNKGYKKAATNVTERLNQKTGTINDQDVADSIAVLKKLDEKGGEANLQQATDIAEKLSEHLTKQGQSIQAASLLNMRTPEGLRYGAQKALKKAGVKVTPEMQKDLKAFTDRIKTLSGEEKDYAVRELQKYVSDNIPADLADKVTSFWKAGLLTGIRTQTGNALSNATFGALKQASAPFANVLDAAFSLGTGQRSRTLTGRGIASGAAEGVQKGKRVLQTGIDERNVLGNKYDTHGEIKFKNKALTTYVNGVFRLMGAADRPAYYAQLRNSLYDLGGTQAKNQGLRGKEAKAFVDKFVKDPPQQAFQVATNEAEKAVLGNDTFLSNIANKTRQAADSIDNPAGKFAAKVGVNVLAPFTKVPSAFIGRVFDFTPVGAAREAVTQISKGRLDQRALTQALSEATTGTGIMYLGAQLANNDLLSGNYPDDPKEQARWKAEGITPNSVKVGDKWLSLNYLGPIGALFSQGKRATDTIKQGGDATEVAAGFTGGAVQDALDQSFLQGVSGAIDAVNDPKRYAQNFVKNQTGSVIPTLSKDIAESTDPMQRQVNNPGQAIQARIPGLRNDLPESQDVYGNPLTRKTSSVNTLINPFRPSDVKGNDVTKEVSRLHNIDPENKDLQVTPTAIAKTVTFNGQKVKLDPAQRTQLQNRIGQTTQSNWDKLMKTSEYKALSDVEKAKALTNLKQDSTELAKELYAQENQLGQYAPGYTGKKQSLSLDAQKLLDSSSDLSRYVTPKQAATAKPKAKAVTTKKAKTSSGRNSGSSLKSYAAGLASINKANASSDKALRDIVGKQRISSSKQALKKSKVALKKNKNVKIKPRTA